MVSGQDTWTLVPTLPLTRRPWEDHFPGFSHANPLFLRLPRRPLFFLFPFNNLTGCFICGCAGSSLLRGPFSNCGAWTSHCGGFSCCEAWALGCMGFSSCGSQALEHRLSSCAQA